MAILTPDINDVARTQNKVGPYRLPVILALGCLAAPTIGPVPAFGWVAVVLLAEAWTWFITRRAKDRPMTRPELISYVASGVVTLPAWASLGVMFWWSDAEGASGVAVALWMGQLLYNQRFIFESRLGVLVGSCVIIPVMIGAPLLHPRATAPELGLYLVALCFGLGFVIQGSLTALRRIEILKAQNRVIEKAATTDSLTGLPNRAQFARVLADELAQGRALKVLYMDLDHFKLVNDTLGHSAGDALLRQFGGRLLEISPPGAVVARLGGDEFALALSADPGAEIEVDGLCRHILAAVKPPFKLPNGQASVGLSIGVAANDDLSLDADDMVRRADIALYAVKGSGRDDFRLFSDDLDAAVRERVALEAALRFAVEAEQGLALAYQPKLDRTGRITGVEALLRWNNGEAAVSPGRFIPLAEETGLIGPLGRWALKEALAFAARWPELHVAVNVSPVQLREPDFVEFTLASAAAAGVAPARIELEVTETVLFEASASATNALNALRAAGFKVALDDFGTGYSSLRHLHSFAVDRVKIDQSFVMSLGEGAEAGAIIQAVVQLGHAMGLKITAEGVETPEQRDFLIATGADELQGFLFSRPLFETDLASVVRPELKAAAA